MRFSMLDEAKPDAILGLVEAFKKDPSPAKINLTTGVFKDSTGNTPVLTSVRKAEEKILPGELTKTYLPIDGAPEFGEATRKLMFGDSHEIIKANRAVTAHTPGGTGALRVAGDFLRTKLNAPTVWLSDPTWPNHPNVFAAAGLETKTYPYFDAETNGLKFDAMLDVLRQLPEGDVVLLHGCCHNPTGIDPTPEQWQQIADVLAERKVLPLLDFAYQGFAAGLREDAAGLRAICAKNPDLLVSSSYSKNFGLYNERVGALTVVGESESEVLKAQGHIKSLIRSNYSNPPAHGAQIVTTILNDTALRAEWEAELKGMRDRINGMRTLFVDTLKAKGVQRDFDFIARQNGMFSFSGLTKDQVARSTPSTSSAAAASMWPASPRAMSTPSARP